MTSSLRSAVLAALLLLAASAPAKFEAILLGTGYPRPDANHASASTAIVAGDKWFVIDAGRNVTMRIAGTDLDYARLQAVFLTHFHSDHIAGLPDLFQTSWEFGRKSRPLELYGGNGVERLARAMTDFFHDDIRIRERQEDLPAIGATIQTHLVHEGVIYDDGVVRVTAFEVDHGPVKPAFGYRFDCGAKSIVVSGDTRPSPNLVAHAKDADILIAEAYLPEHFLKVDTPAVAKKLMSYHSSAEEAGDMAKEAHVRTLVLTHLIPADAEETFFQRASTHFNGKIIVGRDLLHVAP